MNKVNQKIKDPKTRMYRCVCGKELISSRNTENPLRSCPSCKKSMKMVLPQKKKEILKLQGYDEQDFYFS